jgi:hypothetical protein
MSIHGEVEVRKESAVEQAGPSTSTVAEIIGKLALMPSLTLEQVAVVERLVAVQERQDAQRRKEAFEEALRRCQMEMPRVEKNGLIDPKGAAIPYAKLEDIDACIRPIYQRHGFTVTFDAPQSADGGKIRNIARFSCAGHTETLEMTAAPSNRPTGRLALTNAQAVKQTITECRRHLQEMFFNIITKDAEVPKEETITEDQARTLLSGLEETKSNKDVFLRLYRIDKVADLPASMFDQAWNQIQQKRRNAK